MEFFARLRTLKVAMKFVVMTVWLSAALGASAAAGPPDLSGTWQLDAARSQLNEPVESATLTLNHKPDTISLEENEVLPGGKQDSFRLQCGTMGKSCAFKDGREPVEVTVYHNGERLVIMELRGKNKEQVTKKRFSLAPDGQSLTVEVIHISPPGEKTETMVYAKK